MVTLLSFVWLLAATHETPVDGAEQRASLASIRSLLADPYIRMLFGGILFIVGIDVGLNTTIPKLLMEKLGLSLDEAGLGTSLYFSARTIGTFLGAFLLARLSGRRFLFVGMWVAIAGLVLLLLSGQLWVMLAMIVVVGLACANVFSIIFAYALRHRPELDNEISALMIMGVSGGALVMPLMGLVADAFGQVAGLSLLLIGMAYLLWCAKRLRN